MSNNNNDNMVYVVFKNGDYINIEAIFASRESLERYLEEQRIQFEKSWNNDPFKSEIHSVESMFDEGYQITVKEPTFSIDVVCFKLDTSIVTVTNKPVRVWVWAELCSAPFGQMKIFTSEEDAKDWSSNINDPEETSFTEEHELLY